MNIRKAAIVGAAATALALTGVGTAMAKSNQASPPTNPGSSAPAANEAPGTEAPAASEAPGTEAASTEAPEAPGAPDVGHADAPGQNVDNQFDGQQ